MQTTSWLRKAARSVKKCLPPTWAFETQSFLGRRFTGPLRLDPHREHYLNLGCGPDPLPGFINMDFFTAGADYGADLRFPLKIEDDAVDGIFCEHTFEHLTYDQGRKLMAECFRVLKPGATMRLIVPDVSVFVRHYVNNDEDWFREWEKLTFLNSPDPARNTRRLICPMGAISFITQEYGHVSCWDFPMAKTMFEQTGFDGVTQTDFRLGRNKRLLGDMDTPLRKMISLYCEATKPAGNHGR